MQRSNSHEYQLGNSVEEEGAWLLMRLETGESVDFGYTHPLWGGRELDIGSCGGATTTEVHPADGFPGITILVDVDAGTRAMYCRCSMSTKCPRSMCPM